MANSSIRIRFYNEAGMIITEHDTGDRRDLDEDILEEYQEIYAYDNAPGAPPEYDTIQVYQQGSDV